jgi:thiamine-monophosphate kinase
MLSEFDLIAQFFKRPKRHAHQVARVPVGIGDDCALLAPTAGMQLAISSDMLVEGRHFFAGADPEKLGHKSLAVNLSDLAAMGAQPLAFTLALSLPEADPAWLASFSKGLFALADQHDCELIGGDTTKGPLNICITIFGEVPPGKALRRAAAQTGDDIWASGALGDARLALAGHTSEVKLDIEAQLKADERLHTPTPRVTLGLALRDIAHAAIDISDGLIGDLGHILKSSGLGATVNVDSLPIGPMLQAQTIDTQRRFALAGGDDYELCFTAAATQRNAILEAAQSTGIAVTRIGSIEAASGLCLVDNAGKSVNLQLTSFDHFISS